jgi:HK97 family phage major capsid protein
MSEVKDQTDRPTVGAVEERTAGGVAVDGRRIRGVIPYLVESRDMGGWKEIIEPTALRNTDLSELRATIDHKGVPLGRYPHTLDVEDGDGGLHWALNPPKSRQDVVEAVERGDMRAGSWRMVVGKDRWEGDVRHVEEIRELLDVCLVGADEPAYPASTIELRTKDKTEERAAPRVTNEPEKEKEMSEDREVKKGGLEVEAHKVESRTTDFVQEIAAFARDVRRGETRSLSTTMSLSNPEYSSSFFDLLRPRSVFLASGVPILNTDSDSLVYPLLSSDATVAWYPEAGTITASDPGFGAGTAIPRKIATRVEYSNEVADDSSPELEGVLRNVLAGRAATVLDIAAFEGTGSGNQPTGMGNVSGVATVNAAGLSTGSILWGGTAIATLEGAAVPRPYTYAGGTSLIRRLREVRVGAGGNVDGFLYPPTSGDVPPLWGATGSVAPHLSGGTAYFYSPSSMYLVNRVSAFDIEVDRSRLFDRDMSEMRLKARVDFAFPYPTAIVRGTAVPA